MEDKTNAKFLSSQNNAGKHKEVYLSPSGIEPMPQILQQPLKSAYLPWKHIVTSYSWTVNAYTQFVTLCWKVNIWKTEMEMGV